MEFGEDLEIIDDEFNDNTQSFVSSSSTPQTQSVNEDADIISVVQKINRSIERNQRNPREFVLVETPAPEKYNTGRTTQAQRPKRRYTKRKGVVTVTEEVVSQEEILKKLDKEKDNINASISSFSSSLSSAFGVGQLQDDLEVIEDDDNITGGIHPQIIKEEEEVATVGLPLQLPATSVEDYKSIHHHDVVEEAKEKLAEPSSSSVPSSFKTMTLDELGPGFTVKLSLGENLTFKEHLERAEQIQRENIARMVGGDSCGIISKSAQPTSSSSSSSSSSSARATSVGIGSKPHKVELLPVGSAPLEKLLLYIDEELKAIEASIPTTVFDKARKNGTPLKCPREHVSRVLCAPYGFFRGCREKDSCVCKTDFGFTMMEYLNPDDFNEVLRTKRNATGDLGYCYLCWLMIVNIDYHNRANGQGTVATIPLPFYHIASVPKEYKLDAMLNSGSSFTELDLATPVCDATQTSSENTYGLTRPFRVYSTNDYTVGIRKIKFNDDFVNVNYLEESPELFFLTHESTFNGLRSVNAFNYVETTISFQPGTMYILLRLFSPENKVFVVGYCRLGNSKLIEDPKIIRPYPGSRVIPGENHLDDKYHHFALPRYWCIVDAKDRNKYFPANIPPFQMERFPWEFIFTTDLRDSVDHLKEIVRGGRINLVHLFKQQENDLAVTTNLAIPLDHYEKMLDHPAIACRLVYVALKIRLAVLYTVKKVYPSSSHSTRDDKNHHRVELIISWYEENHCKHITKDTFDSDVSQELLDDLSKVPVPYHYYDTDMHYFQYEKKIRRRATPMEVLRERYPEFGFFFREFKEMHKDVEHGFLVHGNVKRLFEEVTNITHYRIATEVADEIDPFLIKNENPSSLAVSTSASRSALLKRPDYSIYITALFRINVALELHESTAHRVEKLKTAIGVIESKLFPSSTVKKTEPLSEEQMKRLFDAHANAKEKLKNIRWLRYNMRLFVFTHLDLIQRMYNLRIFSDGALKSRVPRKNPNYVLTHYDEVYPFASRTPHEGGLPDLSKIIYCVPFPDPTNMDSRSPDALRHDLFTMLNALFPRYRQPRPPISRHLKLCDQYTAYRTLAVKAVELTLLGAYQHADYMPTFEYCVGIHREHSSHFTTERFKTWQSQRGTIAILAMREFLVFTMKLNPPYNSYITRNFPFWVDFSEKVYKAADFMRKMYRVEHSLGVIQHAIHTIFKSTVDKSVLPSHFIKEIEAQNLFKEINFELVRKCTRIDELRSFCQKLTAINRERAKARIPRYGLTTEFASVIEKRVRLISPGSPIQVSWLEEFNCGYEEPSEHVVVTKFTIKLLTLALYFIMYGERGDKYAEQAIRAIPLRDYEVVDAFFFNLHIQYCITVFDLDDDMKSEQWKAICRRYDITPELERFVCPSVKSLAYAPCCGMVKSYVSQACKDPSFGSKDLGVNIYSGEVIDRQNTCTRLEKKAYRVTTLFQNKLFDGLARRDEDELISVCERILNLVPRSHQTRFYSQPECGSVPVMMIPLLGKVVQIKTPRISRSHITNPVTNSFSICTICASVSTFSTRMIGINGFDCNHCDRIYTQQYWVPECVHCYQKVVLSEKNYSMLVFDDRPIVGDFTLKRMYICRHCRKCDTTGYKTYGQHIYTATELKKYKMFQANGMMRFVIMRTGGDLIDYIQSVKHIIPPSGQKQKKSERKVRFE
jgi:hypothetical protein